MDWQWRQEVCYRVVWAVLGMFWLYLFSSSEFSQVTSCFCTLSIYLICCLLTVLCSCVVLSIYLQHFVSAVVVLKCYINKVELSWVELSFHDQLLTVLFVYTLPDEQIKPHLTTPVQPAVSVIVMNIDCKMSSSIQSVHCKERSLDLITSKILISQFLVLWCFLVNWRYKEGNPAQSSM